MAAYVKTLLDKDNNQILPNTSVGAVSGLQSRLDSIDIGFGNEIDLTINSSTLKIDLINNSNVISTKTVDLPSVTAGTIASASYDDTNDKLVLTFDTTPDATTVEIPAGDLTGALVRTVNSQTPDANGDIAVSATNVPYSNSGTELTGTTVQAAVTELSASKAAQTVFGTVWVAGNTYNLDDHVMHNGVMYKCKTVNSDATFTPANWTVVDFAKETNDKIDSLSSDLSDLTNSIYYQDALTDTPVSVLETWANRYFNSGNSTETRLRFSNSSAWKSAWMFAPKTGIIKVKKASDYNMTILVAKGVSSFTPPSGTSAYLVDCSSYVYYSNSTANDVEIDVEIGDLIYISLSTYTSIAKFQTDFYISYEKLTDSFAEKVKAITDSRVESSLQNYTENIIDYTTNLENGLIKDDGSNVTSSHSETSNYLRTKGQVELVRNTAKIYVEHETPMYFTFWFFDENHTLIDNKKTGIGDLSGIFPLPGSKYFRYAVTLHNSTPIDPSYAANFSVYQRTPVENLNERHSIKWCAMGDSISQGWISYISEGSVGSSLHTESGWVSLMAGEKNWELTNMAIGGTGYVRGETNSAVKLAYNTDFSGFNIVTLAYGVNDWKSNFPLGSMSDGVLTDEEIEASPSAVVGNLYKNMRYVIEKILSSNPYCKIVVITPINCSAYGTQEGNWGLSYPFSNNGTLQDIFNAEKEICDYYGIELIDMTHSSIVNRLNAPIVLADGVHPRIATHRAMSREIGAKIGFI